MSYVFMTVAGIGLGVMCFVGLLIYNNSQMHTPHTQRSAGRDSSSYSNNNGRSNVRRRILPRDVCPICLEDCTSNYKILQCSHQYHTACITEWMEQSSRCPVCRANI